MGKLINFLMTNSFEEYKRVNLYEQIGEAAKVLSKEQLVELQKMMNKINSKVAK